MIVAEREMGKAGVVIRRVGSVCGHCGPNSCSAINSADVTCSVTK